MANTSIEYNPTTKRIIGSPSEPFYLGSEPSLDFRCSLSGPVPLASRVSFLHGAIVVATKELRENTSIIADGFFFQYCDNISFNTNAIHEAFRLSGNPHCLTLRILVTEPVTNTVYLDDSVEFKFAVPLPNISRVELLDNAVPRDLVVETAKETAFLLNGTWPPAIIVEPGTLSDVQSGVAGKYVSPALLKEASQDPTLFPPNTGGGGGSSLAPGNVADIKNDVENKYISPKIFHEASKDKSLFPDSGGASLPAGTIDDIVNSVEGKYISPKVLSDSMRDDKLTHSRSLTLSGITLASNVNIAIQNAISYSTPFSKIELLWSNVSTISIDEPILAPSGITVSIKKTNSTIITSTPMPAFIVESGGTLIFEKEASFALQMPAHEDIPFVVGDIKSTIIINDDCTFIPSGGSAVKISSLFDSSGTIISDGTLSLMDGSSYKFGLKDGLFRIHSSSLLVTEAHAYDGSVVNDAISSVSMITTTTNSVAHVAITQSAIASRSMLSIAGANVTVIASDCMFNNNEFYSKSPLMVTLTLNEYNALTPDPNTYYFIKS